MKCTLLLLWDAASNPGTDFIIHHSVPHDRQVTRTGENGESVPQWYFWGRQVSSRLGCDPVTSIKGAAYQGRLSGSGTLMNVSILQHTQKNSSANTSCLRDRGTSHAWMPCCLLVTLLTLNLEHEKFLSWMERLRRVLQNQAAELRKWETTLGWVHRVSHHEKCDGI